MYNGTTSATTSYGAGGNNVRVTFVIQAPVRPRTDPNVEWLRAVGLPLPPDLDPSHPMVVREAQRVRTFLELLEVSPERPYDRSVLRASYRRLIRAAHPDVGGDAALAKRITNAWTELKRRGLAA